MIQGILGRKLGMTRLFDASGEVTATTIVEAGPCFVTQIKTLDRDGYEAVQLGFEQVRQNKLNTPERGHLKESGAPPVRVHAFTDEQGLLHLSAAEQRIRTVRLFDPAGRAVPVLVTLQDGGVTVGTGGLRSGVYVVQVGTDAGPATTRFVKP